MALNEMKLFRVQLNAVLTIEVDTSDAATALKLVDEAFQHNDPLMHANVRLRASKTALLSRAHVLDVKGTAPAEIR